MIARTCVLLVCLLLASAVASAQPGTPDREITLVQGDVYQVRDGDQITLFLVTSDGIVLTDPLNRDLARWLAIELPARFAGRTVRYVVYSSHRHERAAGATLLAEGVEIVAHAGFGPARRIASQSLPPSLKPLDTNQNRSLERSEIELPGREALTSDWDGNSVVTAQEAWGDVASPKITYRTRRQIDLGGKRVELIHPGDAFGPDVTFILFADERILFAAGVTLHEMPSTFAPGSPRAYVDALQRIVGLPFDTVISANGERHSAADLARAHEYVGAMLKGVKSGFESGQSMEQIQAALTLDEFSQLPKFAAQRGGHIAEAYRHLRLMTVDISGAGQFAHIQRGASPCGVNTIIGLYLVCRGVGGATMALSGSAGVAVSRVGVAVEFARGGAVTGELPSAATSISLASRESLMAFMFRYHAIRPGGLGVVVTAGRARVTTVLRSDPSAFLATYSGSDRAVTTTAMTNIFGADLTKQVGRVTLTVPVRLMRSPADLYYIAGTRSPTWSVRIGVGASLSVARLAF
jgi:hypothetical protein